MDISRKGFITLAGLIVPLKTIKSQFKTKYNTFLQKLKVTYIPKIGPPKQVSLFKICNYNGIICIHLPRTLATSLIKNHILDKIDVLLDDPININADINVELYGNQEIIINYLCNNVFTGPRIIDGSASAILNLRAGMGKTFVAAGLISRLKMRTLYIVPKRPLMMQAVKDLRACFYTENGQRIIIGPYGATKKKDPSTNVSQQDITVIVINSALLKGPEFFSKYSMVIYDEVHSYCSDQRREIFRLCSLRVCLGMSATTENRTDGFDVIAHKELAFDGIIRAESIPGFTYEDIKFNCHAKLIYYSGPQEHTQNLKHTSTDRVFTPYMYKQYLRDPYRTKIAVDELLALYDWEGPNGEKHAVYIFAEEIELLKISMRAIINALINRHREDIVQDIELPELDHELDLGAFTGGLEMFTGGLKDKEVKKVSESGRVLCSTYGYAGTGISINRMSCILFLTPRKANMEQIAARILRRNSNLEIPRIIVDIVDTKTCLCHQVGARLNAYNHYDFKVQKIKVKYSDIELAT